MAGNMDPFNMDERVRKYLEAKTKQEPYDPQYVYGKGAIETAGLQGIAGGMAQMGTVHGKTPSVQPYIDSSSKALGGIQALAKEPLMDPQVMQYIMSRTKHPQNPVSKTTQDKLLPQKNAQGNYLKQESGGGITDSGIRGYEPPRAEKEPKPPKTNEANYRTDISMQNAGELKNLIKEHGTVDEGVPGAKMEKLIFELAIDFAKVADPDSVAREGEVAAAKKYMLPIRNLRGFRYTNAQAIELLDNYIQDLQNRKAARDRNTPAPGGALGTTTNSATKKSTLTPEQQKELEERRKRKAGVK